MGIIKQGRLRALRTINGRETEIATFGTGAVLGVLRERISQQAESGRRFELDRTPL